MYREPALTHVDRQVDLELVDEVCFGVCEVKHVAPGRQAECDRKKVSMHLFKNSAIPETAPGGGGPAAEEG